MATTTTGTRARTGTQPSGRGSARATGATKRDGRTTREEGTEERFDLLTAALLGVAVGVSATLLLRSGSRLARGGNGGTLARLASSPAGKMAARATAGFAGEQLARRAAKAAGPYLEDASEALTGYARRARATIDEAVADELRDLKRAIRRQRRRAGL